MAVELIGALAKKLKTTTFGIASVEDETGESGNQVLRVELKEDITVTGSNPLPNGADMKVTANVVFIGNDDVAAFMKGVSADGESYTGGLKLDVAKPQGKMKNGKFEITKKPQVWLTAIRFNKRGRSLQKETQTEATNSILALFGQPVPAAKTAQETPKVETPAPQAELVNEGAPEA